MRCCTACKVEYPATLDYFYKYATRVGLMAVCKTCHKAKMASWVPKNPETYQTARREQQQKRRRPKVEATAARKAARLNQDTKTCADCKATFPKSDFPPEPRNADGLRGICRSCSTVRNRTWVALNWAKDLVRASKDNAKGCEVPHDVDVAYLQDLYTSQKGLCYWFGIPIAPSIERRGLHRPSLDRLVPALGYVRGNVVLTCWAANACRNEASVQAFSNFIGELKQLWAGG